MVNMKIFKTLLELAYDLDILHYEEISPEFTIAINETGDSDNPFELLKKETTKICYMLTNDGDIEILVTCTEDSTCDIPVISYSSKFKSNLRSFSNDLVKDLINTQLETEVFLNYDEYKNIKCSCECI